MVYIVLNSLTRIGRKLPVISGWEFSKNNIKLIDGAFVEDHQYLIDEYGEDGLEIILDEYWNGS